MGARHQLPCESEEHALIVPYDQLAKETLQAVIEDWLSRQAQEVVDPDASQAQLVEQVMQMLQNKRLLVTWDDEMQTINLITPEALQEMERNYQPPEDPFYPE